MKDIDKLTKIEPATAADQRRLAIDAYAAVLFWRQKKLAKTIKQRKKQFQQKVNEAVAARARVILDRKGLEDFVVYNPDIHIAWPGSWRSSPIDLITASWSIGAGFSGVHCSLDIQLTKTVSKPLQREYMEIYEDVAKVNSEIGSTVTTARRTALNRLLREYPEVAASVTCQIEKAIQLEIKKSKKGAR